MRKQKRSGKRKPGIRDWEAKKSVLKSLFSVSSDKGLMEDVTTEFKLGPEEDRIDVVEKLCNTARRWKKSLPRGKRSLEFWDRIIQDQKLKARRGTLWSADIVEFIGYFSNDQDRRNAVVDLLAESTAGLEEGVQQRLRSLYLTIEDVQASQFPKDLMGEYKIVSNENLVFEGPSSGVAEGSVRVDQFYNCPESAKAWVELVDASRYQMYLDCLVSLRKIAESEAWKKLSSSHRTLVALGGGGSPEKDWVLIDSIVKGLASGQKLTYVISDISLYMIHQTVRVLRRLIAKHAMSDKVELRFHMDDFLKLQRTFSRPNGNDQTTWALLGGTIGNVNELQFFQSINGPARNGDMLVLGVDTLIEGESGEEFESRMRHQYDGEETEALLLAPMLYRRNKDETKDTKISIYFPRKGEQHKFTSIPNSRTVAFSHDGCVIATSTRYVLDEFVKFANELGWRLVHSERPREDSSYFQLLLLKHS